MKRSFIKVLFAMVALYDLELEQLYMKITFLHGELEKQIYISPKGFSILGMENHVRLLKKSLYGLKQLPRQWYKRFDTFMVCNGFICSSYNSVVYH